MNLIRRVASLNFAEYSHAPIFFGSVVSGNCQIYWRCLLTLTPEGYLNLVSFLYSLLEIYFHKKGTSAAFMPRNKMKLDPRSNENKTEDLPKNTLFTNDEYHFFHQ